MSREAMEAAMDHGPEDSTGKHILVTIGRFIPADTKTGWVSDRTVAELANVDKNTVRKWRDEMAAAGIIQTWISGAGRGRKTHYKFLFPFNQNTQKMPKITENESPLLGELLGEMGELLGERMGEMGESYSPNNQKLLVQLLGELLGEMGEIKNLLGELLVLLGESYSPKITIDHHRSPLLVKELLDEENQTEKPMDDPHPKDPDPDLIDGFFAFQPATVFSGNIPLPEQRARVIAAACNLDLEIPNHRSQADHAAVQLASYDPQIIANKFLPPEKGKDPTCWNWWLNDWRGQKGQAPTIKDLVANIAQKKTKTKPKEGKNGFHETASGKDEPAYKPVTDEQRKFFDL